MRLIRGIAEIYGQRPGLAGMVHLLRRLASATESAYAAHGRAQDRSEAERSSALQKSLARQSSQSARSTDQILPAM